MRNKPTRQQIITYRVLDGNAAKKEITEFISNNPSCTTSQIISKLRINPEQVADTLDGLERDKLAYGKIVG
jgi:DNA-binding MarR family transcriptional regulator